MEMSITFEDGPITAEISVEEGESYRDVLESLADFVDGYTPHPTEKMEEVGNQNPRPTSYKMDGDGPTEEGLSNLHEIPDSKLFRLIKTGRVENDEIKELPRIIGDAKNLGDSAGRKLLNGAIVILTTFDDFHGMRRVKTSDLMQALEDSGIYVGNFTRDIGKIKEADVFLNRRGRGNSATTEIRPPGKDEAYRIVEKLIK